MQYQEYDYGTETETTTWTPAPAPTPSPAVPAPRTGQMLPMTTPQPVLVNPQATPTMSDMLAFGTLLQSVQHSQNQQTYLLRDMDSRLSRLEDNARYPAQPPAPAPTPSFERATWWALWGLLMLILGSALAVVIFLVILNLQLR